MKTLTAADRSALIRLASTLPKGSEERKTILAGLAKRAASQEEMDEALRAVEWNGGLRWRSMDQPVDAISGPVDTKAVASWLNWGAGLAASTLRALQNAGLVGSVKNHQGRNRWYLTVKGKAHLRRIGKKASSLKVQVDIAPGQEEDAIVEYLNIDGDVAFPVEVSVTLSGKDLARVLGVQERVLDKHLDKKKTLSSSELDRVVKMLGADLQRGAKKALSRIYSGAKVQVMGVADNPYLEYKRTRPDTIEVSFEVDVLAES